MNLFFTNIAYADGVDDFIVSVNEHILNPVIMLMFAIAFIVFLWGVSQLVLNAESEEGRTTGKQHILWGIIGMTIMFSVWGIMNLILGTLETTTGVKGTIDPEKGTVILDDYNPPIKLKIGQ